jgi:hypothetical protein
VGQRLRQRLRQRETRKKNRLQSRGNRKSRGVFNGNISLTDTQIEI